MRYYYTYGFDDDTQAFKCGWSEVIADNRIEADRAYFEKHGLIDDHTLPCAFVYSEPEFAKTNMPENGNFGVFAHEVIVA